MKKIKSIRSSKLLKSFEINKNQQSNISGGAGTSPGGAGGSSQGSGHLTAYYTPGSEGCSVYCPDWAWD